MAEERLRVVVADSGGGEDPAAVVLARCLRDAGAEVVYTDRAPAAAPLAATVVQEDADALGLAGAPAEVLARVGALLREQGADDVALFTIGVAGELPDGVRDFPPGTPPDDVVAWLRARTAGGT
ncbi:methylmalonyl-CoA mutase [Blastococcus sp. SYSU D00820]